MPRMLLVKLGMVKAFKMLRLRVNEPPATDQKLNGRVLFGSFHNV